MKKIPLHSLVVMVGPSGSGKSTLAAQKFVAYEIVASDGIREELTGDLTRQDINDVVFREVHRRVALKLDLGERVVVDATNLRRKDRESLTDIGRRHGVPIYYVVVNRSLADKEATQGWRESQNGLVARHHEVFISNEKEILRGDNVANVIDTRKEDFEVVNKMNNEDLLADIKSRGFAGIMPIGDVHGMIESLKSAVDWASARNMFMMFLGDVLDYGPHSIECVDVVYDIVMRGRGAMVIGNHERKIERWLEQSARGEVRLKLSEGNKATTRQVEALTPELRRKFESKFRALMALGRHHWVIGDTMFVHGAAEPEMFDTLVSRFPPGRFETMALFGEVDNTKQTRDDGYPNRVYVWVDRIPQGKQVIVGHDIRSNSKPLESKGSKGGRAIFMDTGSGKGGRLTTADMAFEGQKLVLRNYTFH